MTAGGLSVVVVVSEVLAVEGASDGGVGVVLVRRTLRG